MRYQVTYMNKLTGERGNKYFPTVSEAFDKASEFLDRLGTGGMQFAQDYFGDIFDRKIKEVTFKSHNGKIQIKIIKTSR